MCSRPSCYVCITHTLTLAAYEHFLTNHRKYPKVSSQLGKYIYIQSVSQFSQLGKYIYKYTYVYVATQLHLVIHRDIYTYMFLSLSLSLSLVISNSVKRLATDCFVCANRLFANTQLCPRQAQNNRMRTPAEIDKLFSLKTTGKQYTSTVLRANQVEQSRPPGCSCCTTSERTRMNEQNIHLNNNSQPNSCSFSRVGGRNSEERGTSF